MRIVGGIYRGRQLKGPPKSGVRPTSSMVREALFNILQNRIEGAHFLDLFSGTGAIGFEALSRGAASVTFVEQSPVARRIIQENAKLLKARACPQTSCEPGSPRRDGADWRDSDDAQGLPLKRETKPPRCPSPSEDLAGSLGTRPKVEIIGGDVFAALDHFERADRRFDILFADPPYNLGYAERLLAWCDGHSLFNEEGLLFVEEGEEISCDYSTLKLLTSRRHGKSWLYQFAVGQRTIPK